MPSPVENTLHTLLPTTNTVPPQLVALANSLLAQSKHTATTLKPEEEIGRIYACCHIACQRQVNKLGLDLGKINPPCAPRVYKKLHGFLDNVLSAGKTTRPTSPKPEQRRESNVDQRKRKAVTVSAAPVPTTRRIVPIKTSKTKESQKAVVDVPEHVAQLGRHLCRVSNAQHLTPHLYAGIELVYGEIEVPEPVVEVVTPNKRARKQTEKAEMMSRGSRIKVEIEKVPLLVLTMFQVALGRSRGVEISTEEGEQIFGELISLLRDQDDDLAEKVYDDQYSNIVEEIETSRSRFSGLGFWQGWIENIPMSQDITTADIEPEQQDDEAVQYTTPGRPLWQGLKYVNGEDDEDLPGAAGLLSGLGTMFQPAVDWLSEERLAHYATWKKSILEQMAQVEHAH